MRYLIDTHTLIWFVEDSSKISETAKKIVETDANCFISIVSFWEIAIKVNLGKLPLKKDLSKLFDFCENSGIKVLPIEFEHLLQLQKLELCHRDPFDRILISQAKSENLTIISKDENFKKYPEVELLW